DKAEAALLECEERLQTLADTNSRLKRSAAFSLRRLELAAGGAMGAIIMALVWALLSSGDPPPNPPHPLPTRTAPPTPSPQLTYPKMSCAPRTYVARMGAYKHPEETLKRKQELDLRAAILGLPMQIAASREAESCPGVILLGEKGYGLIYLWTGPFNKWQAA